MITALVVTAMMLGLLAFFEPCTIATHTLFSARVHRQSSLACCQNLAAVWLTRSGLLAGLLAAAVVIFPQPDWGPYLPSIILLVMAVLYVVSRYTYIPVPHLEFFRLLPGGQRLPFAVKLGLTLPACTLPLVMVVAGMAVSVDSVEFAVLAGVVFASMFTAPMVFAARRGVDERQRESFGVFAKSSPWFTAALLLGAALYLLFPHLEISVDSLEDSLQHASLAGLGLAFLAGFLFSFNPVSFASIPVVLAYVTRAHEERRALLMGAAFVFGMLLTHTVLGVGAALSGDWVKESMGRAWGLLLGPLLMVLGLIWGGWLKIRFPWLSMRARRVSGIWGAFLLAIPFSIAVCPFCTPALLVTLTASAAIGSVTFGGLLLLAFALGRSIPVILGAWSMGWLESLSIISRHQRKLEIIAGITLFVTGLYLLNEYFLFIEY
ncbi:cytochrome c biogenesis CcdA family protein [Thiolapillus sp.]